MSFSMDMKEELSGQTGTARHCQIAELSALISPCGGFSLRRDHRLFLVIQSENLLVVRKAAVLIRRAFQVTPEISVLGNGDWIKGRLYTLVIPDHEASARVLGSSRFLSRSGVLRDLSLPVNNLVIQSSCCKRAFLRGAFLGCGSLSDPRKSYHLEYVCQSPEKAEQIREQILSFGIEARIVERKNAQVVYVKESEGIADLMNVMGAHRSLLEYENIRILRGISGRVNRTVNCETANLNKTISAAVDQVRDIETIRDMLGLDQLPEPLRQMAEVRLEYQDTPLKDLGQYLDPPVGKSGVNHRLRKLKQIAEELRAGS